MILGVNGRFLSSRQTGVQRFASEIVRRLWPRIETGVLLLPRATIAPHGLPRSVTSVSGRLSGQGWEQVELPRAAGAAGCDVVLNPANTLPVAGGPHVVVVHDVEPLTHPGLFSPAFAAWYRWALAPAVRRAARVVTVSRASAAAIADAVGVDPACIRIVDQGAAPFDTPANPAAVEAVRARYGFTGSYLLTVGGHDPRKNVRFLREVLALWRGRADADGAAPAPLLVVVSGGDGRIFSSRSVQKGAKPGELDVGRVDDATLHALYTGAAAFVFPSLSEGFGRPPLEALACGAPVMTSPYLASVEVLGNAADRVPLRAEAWVDGLMRVMGEGPREVAARRKRGIDRVASHSWEAGAAAVIAACREAAGDRVRPGPAAPAGATSRSWAAEVGPRSEPSPALGPPSALTPIHRLAGLRVAIVHDWLTGMRGGERVLESLLALFPQAELFTLLHRPGGVSPTIEARPIHTSLVQRLPGSARHYRWYLPLFPRAIESFAFEGFDLVVSSSHCVAKSAMTDGILHLCYCHTPMRYAWDQFGAYFGSSAAPFRLAAQAATHALRRWDRTSADRVHRFVANSTHVRDRIRTAYGRDATVVYPPVDVDRFTPAATREDFYLVSRLSCRTSGWTSPSRGLAGSVGRSSWWGADPSCRACARSPGGTYSSPAGSPMKRWRS